MSLAPLFLEALHPLVDETARLFRTRVVLSPEFAVAQLVVGDEKFLDFIKEVRTQVAEFLRLVMRLGMRRDRDQAVVARPALAFSFCSASIAPISLARTTQPGITDTSISTRMSSGSPSSPSVEGTKPKS